MTSSGYDPARSKDHLVFILDADLRQCETLSLVFRLEGFRTAFATELNDFVIAAQRRRPDILMASADLCTRDRARLMRLVEGMPGWPVLIAMQARPDVEAAVRLMQLGAYSVVTKPIDQQGLVEAVAVALTKRASVAVAPGSRAVSIQGFHTLTAREREVLQLLSAGKSNKEAALELGISPRTIEVHRSRVMDKLGARNAAELMRIVFTSLAMVAAPTEGA